MHALHLERRACGHAADSSTCKTPCRTSENDLRPRRASRRLHSAFLALWRQFLSRRRLRAPPNGHSSYRPVASRSAGTEATYKGPVALPSALSSSLSSGFFCELDDHDDGRLTHDVGGRLRVPREAVSSAATLGLTARLGAR